jgi:hypothetical protein
MSLHLAETWAAPFARVRLMPGNHGPRKRGLGLGELLRVKRLRLRSTRNRDELLPRLGQKEVRTGRFEPLGFIPFLDFQWKSNFNGPGEAFRYLGTQMA